MQKHITNYFQSIYKHPSEVILCEVCNAVGIDIHHVISRSKFGSKRKDEQDDPSNLICLCRSCHSKAHANTIPKEVLKDLIGQRIKLIELRHERSRTS